MSESLKRGVTVTVDNELGHVLRLTRWDDDHLTIEVGYDGNKYDEGSNVSQFSAHFGIYGYMDDLRTIFADEFPEA